MTFPLGSLRADGDAATAAGLAPSSRDASRDTSRDGSRAASRPAPSGGHTPGLLRAQFRLLVGGVLFLLAVLALVTHSGLDPAFSTSGDGSPVANKAGALGAWF